MERIPDTPASLKAALERSIQRLIQEYEDVTDCVISNVEVTQHSVNISCTEGRLPMAGPLYPKAKPYEPRTRWDGERSILIREPLDEIWRLSDGAVGVDVESEEEHLRTNWEEIYGEAPVYQLTGKVLIGFQHRDGRPKQWARIHKDFAAEILNELQTRMP